MKKFLYELSKKIFLLITRERYAHIILFLSLQYSKNRPLEIYLSKGLDPHFRCFTVLSPYIPLPSICFLCKLYKHHTINNPV